MQRSDFRNAFVKCDSKLLPRLDLAAWADDDNSIELPVTKETLAKVLEVAKFNVLERDRKELLNMQKSEYF